MQSDPRMGVWRQKWQGDLNFEANLLNISKQNQPNMVRDNYIRDHHRKQEIMKHYEDLKNRREKDREEKGKRKAEEADWEKRYLNNELSMFQKQQQEQAALREEQKRKYAEELRAQYQKDQEEKLKRNRMTAVEKRLNYDNLQVTTVSSCHRLTSLGIRTTTQAFQDGEAMRSTTSSSLR